MKNLFPISLITPEKDIKEFFVCRLYVGHRVTALPLASPGEKVRLILQMQPKQIKPVVPASLQQFGAIEGILVSLLLVKSTTANMGY